MLNDSLKMKSGLPLFILTIGSLIYSPAQAGMVETISQNQQQPGTRQQDVLRQQPQQLWQQFRQQQDQFRLQQQQQQEKFRLQNQLRFRPYQQGEQFRLQDQLRLRQQQQQQQLRLRQMHEYR